MPVTFKGSHALLAAGALAIAAPGSLFAQDQQAPATDTNIVVEGQRAPDLSKLPAGPEIKGVITARKDDKIKITTADGASTVVIVTDATQIKGSGGLFGGGAKLKADALLNGLPVTVKTVQSDGGLIAKQVSFKKGDYKTAMMIHNGTAQQFDEQTAATEALRSRVGDIDNYNIKSTTNVYFDTGKAVLSNGAKNDLCAAANAAEGTNNALILVVGYTDSTGSPEFNQALSEKRAAAVINYLQQACHWKPWRMMTPTGMAASDPLASNDTPEGKAQNRRVSVNVLVSKGLDGM